jgi:hypothetical protein
MCTGDICNGEVYVADPRLWLNIAMIGEANPVDLQRD